MPGGRGVTVVMIVRFDILDGAMWTSVRGERECRACEMMWKDEAHS